MEREQQIQAILDFVNRHPESLATRTIRRRIAGAEAGEFSDENEFLVQGLQAADEETLTGYYYLVK